MTQTWYETATGSNQLCVPASLWPIKCLGDAFSSCMLQISTVASE